MNRNSTTDALILSCRQSGENNRLAVMLTRTEGIVRAVLYGGSKSRFRSLVSPYHTGKIWLYTDNVKNSVKITDFDVQFFRPTLRENLYKSWAAALCAEILLVTHSGGETADFDAVFTLVNGFLDGLDLVSEEEAKTGLLRFLWRYLQFLGLQPDIECCAKCGKIFNGGGECIEDDISFYSVLDSGFICALCGRDYTQQVRCQFSVSEAIRRYLEAVSKEMPSQARSIKLEAHTVKDLQVLLYYLIEKAAGGRLKVLEY